MNSKTLFAITALLILSLLSNFYLLTNNKNKQNANLSPTFSDTNTSPTITSLPINPNQKNVSSAFAVYEFRGKVLKLDEVNKNTRITLDISNSQIPDFLITKNTFIINQTTDSKVAVGDIKVGSDVAITMTYRLNQKTWDLTAVVILNSAK